MKLRTIGDAIRGVDWHGHLALHALPGDLMIINPNLLSKKCLIFKMPLYRDLISCLLV